MMSSCDAPHRDSVRPKHSLERTREKQRNRQMIATLRYAKIIAVAQERAAQLAAVRLPITGRMTQGVLIDAEASDTPVSA